VLRTARELTTVNGHTLPAGTRVVALKQEDNGSWRCKVQDPSNDKIRGERLIAPVSRLKQTAAGRPLGSTKANSI
jgi:hypothetical protein